MVPVILSSGTKATSTLGVVDSGSEYLVIPAEIAEYLELKSEDIQYVSFAGGREEARTASVDLLLPGGKPFTTKAIVTSRAISVLLGRSPLFDEHTVAIDYRRGTVSFEPHQQSGTS